MNLSLPHFPFARRFTILALALVPACVSAQDDSTQQPVPQPPAESADAPAAPEPQQPPHDASSAPAMNDAGPAMPPPAEVDPMFQQPQPATTAQPGVTISGGNQRLRQPTGGAFAAPVTTGSAAAITPAPAASPAANMMLNFQNAPLADVLKYLSEAAGFVILQETPVSGNVNIISRQPLTPEESIDLLNAVLVEKGYVALRNGRILKIVSRRDAQKRDLPVMAGSDPEQIPKKDEVVTQILPLRFGEAAKLVDNLRPLLPDTATISANEGANSILLTDTLTNVRRMAEIIHAIDTSVSSISTIKVYSLQYANAKDLATVITQLFANNNTNNNQQQGRRGGFPGMFGPPGGQQPATPQSEARQAASRVVAVADDQSNSLIVSAPDEVIPTITQMIARIDTSVTDLTNTRVFHLVHADAVETADIVNTLYSDSTAITGQNRNQNPQQQQRQQQQAATAQSSQRALRQARVVAVGDGRTNSVLVSASHDTLAEIAEMIGRLDATDAKKQHIYVHSLEHADVNSVANVLRGMLGDQSAVSASQNSVNRLTERSASGASSDANQAVSSGRSTR